MLDYLYILTRLAVVPELLDCLHVAQEHNTTLGIYWQLACSTLVDYNIEQTYKEVFNI